MNNELEALYESTGETLVFGIGTLHLPNQKPAPIIQIHYRDWPREKLEVVRTSFRSGLILVSGTRSEGAHDVYVATRERIALQAKQDGHTSVLRAPAWDAHLAKVDERVFHLFEAERQRYSGFLLLMQTAGWEFLTVHDDTHNRTIVGVVLPHSLPAPNSQSAS